MSARAGMDNPSSTSHSTHSAVEPSSSFGGAALGILLPLLAAVAIIWGEPLLGQIAQERPGVVPVILLSILVGMMSRVSRRWLVVTLCFGVALLALREFLRELGIVLHQSFALTEPAIHWCYVAAWIILTALSAAAAVGEAIQPGTIWARRCYFLATSLYFIGHGLLSFVRQPTWHSPVFVLVGLVALVAAWRVEQFGIDEPEPLDDDLEAIQVRSLERSAALSSREWVEKH